MVSTALSKIIAPILPPAIVHRAALIARMCALIGAEQPGSQAHATEKGARYKLFLLCAPAGYGKTTLLADFARSTGIPCCWYFLDQNDIDLYTFLSGLLASIRYCFPGFGVKLDPLLALASETSASSYDNYPFEAFIDALITAFNTEIPQHFVLLLSNYHEVDESPLIVDLINYLLKGMSSRCTLIIESRTTPSIEFASLLAHRQAIGWGSNMLRMTAEEIQELAYVQGVAPLSHAEAEQLALVFDGWIAGIFLGTRLGDTALLDVSTRTGVLQGLPTMRVERQKLFAYLVNEIFRSQPAAYAFLKDVSILSHMDPTLCDALLGTTDASVHLRRLVRQGMFVTCNDDGPQPIYTCHPVLRELLCDELSHQSPERFAYLHRRASELFAASHEYDKAVTHALAAGDDPSVARLIIQAYTQRSLPEHTGILERWIDALPPATLESYPQLLLIRAHIYLLRGEHARAFPLLDILSNLRDDQKANIDPGDLPLLQMESMILRSKALSQMGEYQNAQLLCLHVLKVTPMDEVRIRAEAHARVGICAGLLGNLTSGVEHLQKALQLWGRNTIRSQTADVHSALASCYNLLGNFALAEHHISRALSCCDQLHDKKGKVNNLIRLGVYKQRQGMLVEAETILLQALTIASENGSQFEREEAYVLVNLGSVYQDQGSYDRSLETLERGIDLARRLQDNYLVNCSLCYLSMTYLLMGDASTAMLLVSETNLTSLASKEMGYERAIHDLAYGTILLDQRHYDDAYACFTTLEASLTTVGFRRELLRVKLRIAACQLARQKMAEVIDRLEQITSILESLPSHESLILSGLSWHAELYQLVKTHPALERLRTLLSIEQPPVFEPKAEDLTLPGQTAKTETPTISAISDQFRLKIQALGEPTVFLDREPITRWRMARAMELFFFLLNSKHPMRKEQIVTALWSEVDDQINQTFHSTIHYLRKALHESCIVSHRGIYSLNLSSFGEKNVLYDVALFEEQYAQGKRFLETANNGDARKAFRMMVELYQGDYVQSFYNDWCSLRRGELRRAYQEAHLHLADLAWQQEEFDESAVHWQNVLAMDNWIEEAHYGLMKYYIRKRKRAQALRQYQRCVEALQQELGTQPGPAIQNLYNRIMSASSSEQNRKG
jgi:ATP/maltotriose-dependent transcriptional regulator MalT/DNA-binding SARP family transcriptional activator